MIQEGFLESLGWEPLEVWCNRIIYGLGEDVSLKLFEHCGEVGIVDSWHFYYCNLSEVDIRKLTDVLRQRAYIYGNPDNYTLRQGLMVDAESTILVRKLINKK